MPPPEKKARVGEQGEVEMKQAEETPENKANGKKEPEEYKEVEENAPKVKNQLPSAVVFHPKDTTLNLMPSDHCNVLKPLAEGGLQFLFAGARANVGVKSGRYMFEVKIIENPMPIVYGREKAGNYLKIGFSTSAADLFVGSNEHSVCFDTDGSLLHNEKKIAVGKRWIHRDVVGAVLLNLDKKSPNYNTVSLFKDGLRMCKPQPLPESLHGKTLFPAVTFRNVTVHTNFGPEPLSPLPFTCTMVGGAEASDVEVIAASPKPKDGKYEVVYPVCVPGQGGFEWLDLFIEKNPKYTELSDRALLTWCEKSGIWRKGGYDAKTMCSFDKPELPGVMDDKTRSLSRLYSTLAPLAQRDFVVMELKSNLVKEDRATQVLRFPSSSFKQVACVVMGEPTADFVKLTHAALLKDKQAAADEDFKRRKLEELRQKELEKKAKQMARAKKKADAARQKALAVRNKQVEDAKKALEDAKKAAEGEEAAQKTEEGEQNAGSQDASATEGAETDQTEEKKEEGNKEEEAEKKEAVEQEAEEMDEENEEDEPDAPEGPEEEPPTVELTDEDKKVKFHAKQTPDIAPQVLTDTFAKFTLPTKDEGFAEIRYEWTKDKKCEEYFRQWLLDKKQSTRVEHLKPSAWLITHKAKWDATVRDWSSQLANYNAVVKRKENEKIKKHAEAVKKAAAAKAVAAAKAFAKKKKAEELELKRKEAAEKGETFEEPPEEDVNTEEVPVEEQPTAEIEEEPTVDFDAIDVFGIDDVTDVGGGIPLFKEFRPEDWTLMTLKLELSLLVHAFHQDVDDPDRTGIPLDHLDFYYERYYRKKLTPKAFGVETIQAVVKFAEDSVYLTEKKVLQTFLPKEYESFAVFAKLTEEARRHRKLIVNSGDEGAQLKFPGTAPTHAYGKGTADASGKDRTYGKGTADASGKDGPYGKGTADAGGKDRTYGKGTGKVILAPLSNNAMATKSGPSFGGKGGKSYGKTWVGAGGGPKGWPAVRPHPYGKTGGKAW